MSVRNFQFSNTYQAQLRPSFLKPCGFTLIEIMVAVFIMVVATGFLVVNLGQSNGQVLHQEARKIAMLINHGLDEAVLTGQALGVQFNPSDKTYQFINLDQSIGATSDAENAKDSFMRVRSLPEGVSLNLDLLEKKKKNKSKYTPDRVSEILNSSILDKASNVFDEDKKPKSAVVMEPNGLIAPFTLELQAKKESITIKLGDAGSAVVIDSKIKN